MNGLPNVCRHPPARNQDRVHATQSQTNVLEIAVDGGDGEIGALEGSIEGG